MAEVRAQLNTLIGVATWASKTAVTSAIAIVGSIIAGAAGGAWWASGINSDVRTLTTQVAEVRKAIGERTVVPVSIPPGKPIRISPIEPNEDSVPPPATPR